MTSKPNYYLVGRVVQLASSNYWQIENRNAPSHLQTFFLINSQMNGAIAGDIVKLEYVGSRSSGLWNVTKILKRSSKRPMINGRAWKLLHECFAEGTIYMVSQYRDHLHYVPSRTDIRTTVARLVKDIRQQPKDDV
jgi:hypothetical protein